MRSARWMLACLLLPPGATGVAAQPAPQSDIALECRSGNVPVYGCVVRCSHPPAGPAAGGPATGSAALEWLGVSRVEVYAGGRAAGSDGRLWLLIERDAVAGTPAPAATPGRPPPGPPPPRPVQSLHTIGANVYCAWEPVVRPGVEPYQQPYFLITRFGRGG